MENIIDTLFFLLMPFQIILLLKKNRNKKNKKEKKEKKKKNANGFKFPMI